MRDRPMQVAGDALCPCCKGRYKTEERAETANEITFMISFCKVCERGRVPDVIARAWWQRTDATA